MLLDERYYRDDDVIPEGPIDTAVGHIEQNSAFGARTFVIKDPFDAREAAKLPTMLGAAQREWATTTLHGSTATWKVVASPVVMAQMVYAESTRNGLAIVELGADALDVQFVRVGDVTSPAPSSADVVAFRTPRGWRASGQPAVTRS